MFILILLIPVQHLRVLLFSSLFMFLNPFSDSEKPSSNISYHLLHQLTHLFGITTLLTTQAASYICHSVPPPTAPFLWHLRHAATSTRHLPSCIILFPWVPGTLPQRMTHKTPPPSLLCWHLCVGKSREGKERWKGKEEWKGKVRCQITNTYFEDRADRIYW